MKERFECDIGCESRPLFLRNKLQRLDCPNCIRSCCVKCQYSYGRDDCMNCHLKFQHSYVKEYLGERFLKEVVKPRIIRELMVEQERRLPDVQPMVDWEKQIRQQKRDARFGIIGYPIERPSLDLDHGSKVEIFACPINGCRGFVKGEPECATCHQIVCLKCHQSAEKSHICKIEDLKSIQALKQETKRCPRCTAPIYKTEGCNDMYCTNCRGHFSWSSGKALETSTNGHYLNLAQYARDIATIDHGENQTSDSVDCTGMGFSLTTDTVRYIEIAEFCFSEDLVKALYEDSNVVRLAKRVRFHQPNIVSETNNSYLELQISYLLKDIDYAQWSNRVYQLHRKQELALMYAGILDIYLSTIGSFQERLRDTGDEEQIRQELVKLIDLVNSSFESIRAEYGGGQLRIRSLTDDPDVPIFIT